MQKKFILNLILLLFLNLLIKPFYVFFIDVQVQRVVGLGEYGLYLSIFNFTFVVNILLDMGITNFNNRNIAQNSQLLGKYFPHIVVIRFILALAYIAVVFIMAVVMNYEPRHLKLLGILAFNQFLLSFTLYLRSNISGLLHFVTDSIISVLDKILLIVFCLILLYAKVFSGRFCIEWFIYAQTVAYIITTLTAFFIVVKDSGFSLPKFNRPLFLLILRKSFPFALLTLLMACYNKIDTVMMKQLIPGEGGIIQVGIYGHSVRVLDAFNNFSYLFAVLLLPIYARMLKMKESVGDITKTALGLLVFFSFTLSTLCMYYCFDIMDLMYEEEINYSAKVFQVLIYCFPSMSLAYIFGTLLTANGSLKQLNIISLCGLVINIGLNLILIPRFGALGAAYTGVITQFLVVVGQIMITKRTFSVVINRQIIKYIMSLGAYIVSVLILGYFLTGINTEWYTRSILHLFMSVVLAIIFNLFNVKELFKIIKSTRK